MTLQQMNRFVKRVNYQIPIPVYISLRFQERHFSGQVTRKGIWINQNRLQESDLFLKCLLLHEVGHFNIDVPQEPFDEYMAQCWAINRARELKFYKMEDYLIREILFLWHDDKDEKYKSYKLASNRFYRDFPNLVEKYAKIN